MKIVAGLGNPGPKYEQSRHNAGFLVVDYLAHVEGAVFSPSRFKALLARITVQGETVLVVKPQTYMNLSGLALAALIRFYKLDPTHDLLIVSDDLDLPLGRLRFRSQGGHGGQRGLLSIIEALGTAEFSRLRFGIGRPTGPMDAKDYVLTAFDPDELPVVDEVVPAAAQAVGVWIEEGPLEAMNRYNAFDARPKAAADGQPGDG